MSDTQTHAEVTTTRFEAILDHLDGAGVKYTVVEHERVQNATDEAHAVGRPPGQVAKTVVLHDGRAYALAVVPASRRLDLHKLRELLGATGHLRLASESEIAADFPTMEVGAVPPFGPMMPMAEVIDERLLSSRRILCAAGDHRHSVLVHPRDVVRITAAQVADICED